MIGFFYRRRRPIAVFFIVIHLAQIAGIRRSYALTSGPSQPEVQGFQQVGASDMVDLFTGDFSYNIPLFELPGPNGGYPFNLSYQGGISMDAEASWVGLGFSLQPGAINRQMRGLPDEFKGDEVRTKTAISPSVTVGLKSGTGVELFGKMLGLSTGFGVYQNNYRGMGYTIDIGNSVNFLTRIAGNYGTAGIGMNVSMDSKEGINVSPSLNLSNQIGQVGIATEYNSKSGLGNLSFNYEAPQKTEVTLRKAVVDKEKNETISGAKTISASMSASATLTLAHPSYTPEISMPMRNTSLSATFKLGGAWWGVHPNWYLTGFYNEQRLRDNNKYTSANAYGYLNYQHANGDNDLMDFNREKDGIVMKESPNLAMPSLTYDVYSVVGQGIAAMYRPMRNDIGIIHDKKVESVSNGYAAGVDIGVPAKVGVNLNVNHTRSTSGSWTGATGHVEDLAGFTDRDRNDPYEPVYFKAHGEPSRQSTAVLNNIGGDDAVRLQLTESNADPALSDNLENNDGSFRQAVPGRNSFNRERTPRNQVIQPITNAQLMGGGGEVISTFKIRYIDSLGNNAHYVRTAPTHHTAGFIATTTEGVRYTYGIPAYNRSQEETVFSAKRTTATDTRVNVGGNGHDPTYTHEGTDKFLKRVNMPEYAHAFLLTSIVGPDYVDVTGDGVTEDDLGYWVKFTYRRTTSDYQWRDPYSRAHLQKGWETDPRDDRGSFSYGRREQWYLAQAETKSHVAKFTIEARVDGKGVKSRLQDNNDQGREVYKLTAISLYTRVGFAASLPAIKTVRFNYDYSLCANVFNSAAGQGKLTLRSLYFEYGGSQRGKLNPYKFTYAFNPGYDMYAYDRWGTYKPKPDNPDNALLNVDFPYSEQNPQKTDEINRNAGAWSLSAIDLPSGGKIQIDYESDDYAYVQHKPAMQMMTMVDPSTAPNFGNASFGLADGNSSVRFRLEQPLDGSLSADEQKKELMRYFDLNDDQLFFKAKINLRGSTENFYEYISGYVTIDYESRNNTAAWKLEKDATGRFVYGVFVVKKEDDRNPFSLRAWQHLRTNQPELANSGRNLEQTDDADKRISQIKSLGSVITQVSQMFKGFNAYCSGQNWGRQMQAEKSWIRLRSPDKIKFGGGARVRQITMTDNWADDAEGIYGQVYEYTTKENGQTISSGVATYEPFVGGEENPLRTVKKYTVSVPLRSDNDLYFEYPVNESNYPGASVGYRKVKVTSLAAAALAGNTKIKNAVLPDGKDLFPKGDKIQYGTTGATIHEFYTAKDFPVITDETEKKNKPHKQTITVPFLGSISTSKLTASQGYSIVNNDMHGKPRQISNYRQERSGKIDTVAMSWVRYNYATTSASYQRQQIMKLRNTFSDKGDGTLSLLGEGQTSTSSYTLGQETEFFIDLREFEDAGWGGGAFYNTDLVYVLFGVIPIPTTYPDVSKSTNRLRTAVTNKLIFKTGILESTEAYDGGSRVVTKNFKWDKYTGAVIVTQVNNNFDDPVYSYTIPAYTQYQGMGAACQNIGITFAIDNIVASPYATGEYRFSTLMNTGNLFPGDEILLYADDKLTTPITRVVYLGDAENTLTLYSQVPLSATDYTCMVVRSGHRNQLSVMAGAITALQDPSLPGTSKTHAVKVTVPKEGN